LTFIDAGGMMLEPAMFAAHKALACTKLALFKYALQTIESLTMHSPELTAFLKNFPQCMMDANDPMEVVRVKMAAIHPNDHADDTIVERVEIAGVPCAWVSGPETDPSRTVFFVHGGAFVSTGITEYMRYGEKVARYCRARVLVSEYSLSPEAQYPKQHDELLAVYDAVALDPARTVFMGDSCGGGMALALMCKLRDRGSELPACYAGLTPWLDSQQSGDAAQNPRGVDPFVSADWIRARFKDYMGSANAGDPYISPIDSELSNLPPLYLGVGTVDTTSDDSTRFAVRAAQAGLQVLLDINAGLTHGMHGLEGICPEGDRAMERVGAFVQSWIPDLA
jgi:acetyl esterase/lipase